MSSETTSTEHLEKTRAHRLHKSGEQNGCLVRCKEKGHSHRYNGRMYQASNEASHYNIDFTKGPDKDRLDAIFGDEIPCKGGDPRPKEKAKAWHMVGSNYFPHDLPWANQAHHVVPVNVIAKVFPTLEELELLLVAKYNVNRGLNVIMLPSGENYGKAMGLPVHLGSHGSYDSQVETKLNSIRANIKKAEDPQREGHPELKPENVQGITTDIETFAKRMRKMLLLHRDRFKGVKVNDAIKLFNPRGP